MVEFPSSNHLGDGVFKRFQRNTICDFYNKPEYTGAVEKKNHNFACSGSISLVYFFFFLTLRHICEIYMCDNMHTYKILRSVWSVQIKSKGLFLSFVYFHER